MDFERWTNWASSSGKTAEQASSVSANPRSTRWSHFCIPLEYIELPHRLRYLGRVKLFSSLFLAGCLLSADRPVPPAGVAVPANDRAELEAGLDRLSRSVEQLRGHLLAPDVIIYRDSVRFALAHGEFFKTEEIGRAKELLRQGQDRAESLLRGQAPWTSATGLVVRGYRSQIDDSVQPYGLVIPPDWSPQSTRAWRVDTWFHGRNETLSEVNFLWERQTRPGEFTPPGAIVLHLYGRYCNANKLAGEVDLFEALDDVRRHYRVDENRIAVRGFSMGGAAAWHIAAHYPGLWAAAAPGAGFSETREFLGNFKDDPVQPAWWEQKLWRMYDATEYAANFFNLPLVAYSGEIDKQKQAADIMERYLKPEGLRLTHIIGPGTPHRYHPDAKREINRRLDAILERGRAEYPRELKFTTYTLRYHRVKWLQVDRLAQHWEKARVHAVVSGDAEVKLTTANVNALTLDFGPGGAPFAPDRPVTIKIDGAFVEAPAPETDRGWRVSLHKAGGRWTLGAPAGAALAKRHGLQGPIDDAFLSRFIFVLPTGEAAMPGAAERIAAEQARAIREWRRQFRGEPLVKKDTEITDADIASAHLVLWGDPGSNKLMARVIDKLPLRWSAREVKVGDQAFAGSQLYPVMAYPNPLNPSRYVVLNSGFTFREYDYLNNARQIPKLPDWAVVDAATPADGRFPGKITGAGFFDESWRYKQRD